MFDLVLMTFGDKSPFIAPYFCFSTLLHLSSNLRNCGQSFVLVVIKAESLFGGTR